MKYEFDFLSVRRAHSAAALNFGVHMAYCICVVPDFIRSCAEDMLAVGVGSNSRHIADLEAYRSHSSNMLRTVVATAATRENCN